MYMQTLIFSLLEILIMVLLGYLIKKKEIISSSTFKDLSNLLLSVTLPLSILASGAEKSDAVSGKLMLTAAGASFLYYALAFVITFIAFKALGNKDHKEINTTMCIFANTGFIGFPLTKTLYGTEGLMYAVIYNLAYNAFFFTLGTKILAKSNEKFDWKSIFLNPLTIASILAIFIFGFSIPIPDIIKNPMQTVGDMTVPLSMIIIGGELVGLRLKNLFMNKEAYLICAIRLLVFPLLALCAFIPLQTSEILRATIILITALPIGSLNVIVATKYGYDTTYANETMFLSMLLSVVTIPLIMLLI